MKWTFGGFLLGLAAWFLIWSLFVVVIPCVDNYGKCPL
jgi:hypothetical protein